MPWSGLCDEVAYRAGRVPSEVLIVAPALTRSRLHYLASDIDHEAEQAAERMETLRGELERQRVHATGRVGDTTPCSPSKTRLESSPPTSS